MENSLARMRPELVTEWSTRNLPITPADVPYGSKKVYWWRGVCGHEWNSSAKARSQGEKCPICSGKRIVPGINDLASLMPALAAEWSEKNPMPPTAVGVGSHKKVIWQGKCGHEWIAVIRSRAGGAGCPFCSHNVVLPGFNDLDYLFPEIAKEWSTANLPLLPSQVTPFANKKVSWVCKKGHTWDALISTRSYGSQCPYCSGIKLLKGFNDFATTHPDLAMEWSDKNIPMTPDTVNAKSASCVWWHCRTCGNDYQAVIKSRVKGLRCPVCAQRSVLTGYNDLATTDPEIILEWDYDQNVDIHPAYVSRQSMRSVWWKGKCGHSWKDKIYNRVFEGNGCIYCKKETKKKLPYQLLQQYTEARGLSVLFSDDSIIGVPLDAYIPDLKLAFLFKRTGSEKEQGCHRVIRHLCVVRRIQCIEVNINPPEEFHDFL